MSPGPDDVGNADALPDLNALAVGYLRDRIASAELQADTIALLGELLANDVPQDIGRLRALILEAQDAQS